MSAPRLALFTPSFPPDVGAAAHFLAAMAKAFTEAGWQVRVYTAMPNYPHGKLSEKHRLKWRVIDFYEGVEVYRHWLYASHSTKMLKRGLNMLSLPISVSASVKELVSWKPDLVLAQYPPVILPILARKVAKRSGANFALNVSDLWPHALTELGIIKPGILLKQLQKLEKSLYTSADLLIGQSEEVCHHLEGVTQKEALLCRTGASPRLFSPKQSYAYQQPFKLVYTGVLGLAHGLSKLCQEVNFGRLGVELHIYGAGDDLAQLKKLTEKDKGLFLHEPEPLEQVGQLLLQADAALICQRTAIRGTFPSKTYEACMAAMPVLFHGGGEATELLKHHQCALISEPEQPKQFVSNVQQLMQMLPSQRAQMGKQARTLAEKNFVRSEQLARAVAACNKLL